MIMKMVIKEAQGYDKETALESTGLEISIEKCKNATVAWKKAGSPLNTKDMNKFCTEYLKNNKLISNGYIIVESASADTRVRPYSIINETTQGKRKTTTTYQIKEADLKVKYNTYTVVDEETGEKKEVTTPTVDVVAVGAVEARANKKDEAFKLMKGLIEETKKTYAVEIVKEVTEGQKYAGYGLYTPSKSAKLGKFVFFSTQE